jgi:hypothetical protein
MTKIVKRLVDRNQEKMGSGFSGFRGLLYDKDGKKINVKKKGTGGKKNGTKKPEDKRTSN